MVGSSNTATALLALWGTFVPGGASIIDPTLMGSTPKRRLRHRQTNQLEQRKHSIEQNRANRLGAAASSNQRKLQEQCILQGNLYGTFDGNYRNVEFLYQGVFEEGTSQTQINLNILPNLEREIVSGILPAFFDCPGQDPTGVVNGISPSDADSLSVGGTYPFVFFIFLRYISNLLIQVLMFA